MPSLLVYHKFIIRFLFILTIASISPWLSAPTLLAQAADPASIPIRLTISRVGIDTVVESVGKSEGGEVGVPQDAKNAAWYNPGIVPGAPGNAVIAGHLDDKKGRAAFWRLRELKVGDTVTVVDQAGKQQVFAVIEVASYPYDQAPLNKIFGFDLEHDLNLITCTGRWNSKTHTYSKRLVVYTRLVEDSVVSQQ